MLQIQPSPNLTPLSFGHHVLDLYIKLDQVKIKQIFEKFLIEDCHIPTNTPPYATTFFSETVKHIITMLSCILGYTTNEHVDEFILAFLSIFTPSKTPVIMFDHAMLISDRMHEQFIRLLLKEFSNTLHCCFICSCITREISSL